jgi:DHA1 family inner membrane transport protein
MGRMVIRRSGSEDSGRPRVAAGAGEVALGRHRGNTVSYVIGIPLGSIIGTYSGWRMTFVMVAVLGVVALLGIRALLPDVESPPVVGFRDHVDALGRPEVVVALCLTPLGLMGGSSCSPI